MFLAERFLDEWHLEYFVVFYSRFYVDGKETLKINQNCPDITIQDDHVVTKKNKKNENLLNAYL